MPVFQIRIDPSGVVTGARVAENAMKSISTSAKSAEKAVGQIHANNSLEKFSKSATVASTNIRTQLGSIAVAIGGVAAAYKTLEAAQNFLKSGVRYNAEWQQGVTTTGAAHRTRGKENL